MTMVASPRASLIATRQRSRVVAHVATCSALCLLVASPLMAQLPPVHYRHTGDMPPGAIGSAQLQRGGPLPGYFQPVEVRGPEGIQIAFAADGEFLPARNAPVFAGLLIAPVYRLQVTRIPFHAGAEVFPTIEVIDRLYPPVGQERRFPIVIELTQEDLELALKGNFVTRVIYLEDPETALPAQAKNEQIGFDAGAGEDALQLADSVGRPVAILRLGGRLPLNNNGELDLRADSAPLFLYQPTTPDQLRQYLSPGNPLRTNRLQQPAECQPTP